MDATAVSERKGPRPATLYGGVAVAVVVLSALVWYLLSPSSFKRGAGFEMTIARQAAAALSTGTMSYNDYDQHSRNLYASMAGYSTAEAEQGSEQDPAKVAYFAALSDFTKKYSALAKTKFGDEAATAPADGNQPPDRTATVSDKEIREIKAAFDTLEQAYAKLR